ncbi:SMC-Scp complex subunit ScpB [Rhodohalobacter sp. SW132]|uniref:SMC-Scp complex subunit ScpB n=1 Tax=Rhodohalobacter sp. SW132 TaxID=2293433 RepID=UPI001F0CCD1B|nr:SMC-Scp complex subunit ScpB [Rhodohalobacter sp. SW132]
MLDYRFVDGTRLTAVIEALIFSSPQPIGWEKLSEIVTESEEDLQLNEEIIKRIINRLNERYEENDLAFRIEETGGGYTFVTQPRYHPWLSIFQHENAYRKLSQSATETLAIVAYRQPITKPEVDDIRGVDSGYILRQLLEKMLVRVSGRADSPGKPLLYKTTKHFLKHFGINSVDELPKPREIDEILKDDDMADHRRLLMERQMELEDEEARQMFDEYSEKREKKEPDDEKQNTSSVNGSGNKNNSGAEDTSNDDENDPDREE